MAVQQMESFSTRGLPTTRKLAYWNALSSETFTTMQITPRNAGAFDGELRREPIGPLTLMDVSSAAVQISHTRYHVNCSATPSYLLLTPLSGEIHIRVSGHSGEQVSTGEFCLLDHARPYELEHGDEVRTLCLDIPRASLELMVPLPQAAIGRVMRADRSLARILITLLRELSGDSSRESAANSAPALAQGLLGFVAAAYAMEPETSLPVAVARRQALLASIDARVNDPDLTPADIAVEAGISTRRLRAVLADGGESFSGFVLRRRLENCARLLRDTSWDRRSITEVAFRTGFNNVTHFGYAFKRRFGVSPREYRQRR
jgi:AraC-like DNA-binding protein